MRKVPLKNYLILLFIVIFTCVLTFYLANFYKERNKTISVIHGYVSEITEKELTDYIIENPIIFMYISDKYNLENNKFEEDLLKEIKTSNLKDYFVCLNTSDLTSNFESFFQNNYNLKLDLTKTPILIIINDGKIINMNYIDIYNYDIDQIVKTEVIK